MARLLEQEQGNGKVMGEDERLKHPAENATATQ
jgi:hypothetical protein